MVSRVPKSAHYAVNSLLIQINPAISFARNFKCNNNIITITLFLISSSILNHEILFSYQVSILRRSSIALKKFSFSYHQILLFHFFVGEGDKKKYKKIVIGIAGSCQRDSMGSTVAQEEERPQKSGELNKCRVNRRYRGG